MHIRKLYNKFTIEKATDYLEYQHSKGLTGPVQYYWFTIQIKNAAGNWNQFQQEFNKYVTDFYYNLCEDLIKKRFNRDKYKHLKPFLYAAVDCEDTNSGKPQDYNHHHHIHGLILMRQSQSDVFNKILIQDGQVFNYHKSFKLITAVKLYHLKTPDDIKRYIDYINKNLNCYNTRNNPNMYLPHDNAFIKHLNDNKKPYMDGQRLRRN